MSFNPTIIKTKFIIDKNRQYEFDVDNNISMYALKRMITAATDNSHLSSIEIKYKGKSLENIYNKKENKDENSPLYILFNNEKYIEFTLKINYKNIEEFNDLIKLKLKNYCSLHNGKYPYFYCFTCNKSFCSICLNEFHQNHNVKEKYDYLQSTKSLIEQCFYDLDDILKNIKEINGTKIDELRNEITLENFPRLIEQIRFIENKLLSLITYFVEKEKLNFQNIKKNVILLKKYCAEGIDKLKSEIEIEDMMTDEKIFLTFHEKLNTIAKEKEKFNKDVQIFKNFSDILNYIINTSSNTYKEILDFLMGISNNNIMFNNIKNRIDSENINEINKENIDSILKTEIKPKQKGEENSYFKNSPFIEKEVVNDSNYNRDYANISNNLDNEFINPNLIVKKTVIKTTTPEMTNFDTENNNLNNNLAFDNTNIVLSNVLSSNNFDNNKNNSFNSNFDNNKNNSFNSNFENNKNNSFNSNFNNTNQNFPFQNNQNALKSNQITYTFGFRPNNNNQNFDNNSQILQTSTFQNTTNINPLTEKTEFKETDSSDLSISSYEPTVNTKKIYKLICNVIPNSKQVVIFDSSVNKISRKNLEFPPQMGLSQFLANSAWVNYNNHLYVSGGVYGSNSFILYNPIKSRFTRHTDSLFSHEEHSLIANGQYVFLVGGFNNKTERYNIKEKKFESLGELKFIQKRPILFIYNNYLYSFFGMDENNQIIDKVQRRNIKNLKGKWEEVAINNEKNIDVKMYGAGIIKISEDVIYFLGGKGNEGLRQTCIEFNFKNMSLNNTPYNLEDKAYFKEGVLMRLNENSYGNFSLEMGNPFLKITFIKN